MRVFTAVICAVRSRRTLSTCTVTIRRTPIRTPTPVNTVASTSAFTSPILPERPREIPAQQVDGVPKPSRPRPGDLFPGVDDRTGSGASGFADRQVRSKRFSSSSRVSRSSTGRPCGQTVE